MKKFLGLIVVAGALVILAGLTSALWGNGPGTGGWGWMGPGMMAGRAACPGWITTNTPKISEEKAKELAQNYADQYLTGFKVERVLPFAGMHHTMYSVELKNAEGELRALHINPFGDVIPYGGPWRRG
ncbi:MAG: hypothetical protein ACE5FB_06050 [Candidatus Binatia bacterium]